MERLPVLWDACKYRDGSYDLRKAAHMTGCKITEPMDNYLAFVENIRPVTSRQIGALAIATAMALYPPEPQAGRE